MTNNKQLKVPYFAKGTYNSLQVALNSGVFASLDRVAFVFLIDRLEWVMIDTNKAVYTLKGFTEDLVKKYVQRGNSLPSADDASTDVLYVVGDVVYTFDGTRFHTSFESLETVVTALEARVDDCATKDMIGALPNDMSVVDYVNDAKEEAISSSWQYTDEQIELHIVE